MSQPSDRETKTRPCPICGKPASVDAWPFCSTRCADVDLHRWLKGSYAIPTADAEPEVVPDEDASDGESRKN